MATDTILLLVLGLVINFIVWRITRRYSPKTANVVCAIGVLATLITVLLMTAPQVRVREPSRAAVPAYMKSEEKNSVQVETTVAERTAKAKADAAASNQATRDALRSSKP